MSPQGQHGVRPYKRTRDKDEGVRPLLGLLGYLLDVGPELESETRVPWVDSK